ncbi:hypothetical protein D9619_011678 [Psilocybe cf. subviscida]|uniref:Arabinan endo-1,5-alpha-L-arabinosidase n=1 Tax=Psilocybe cf. subviscida TaxID=2480587 RepID=A0A8H5F9E3_9AGAR|nr:hypothetical protein D9619_011678 [Psilocybe cf. subviscida]
MRGLSNVLLLLASTFAGLVTAQVGPGVVTGNVNVHDPTICKDNSGKYFLFSTAPGIEIRTSTDRTAWTFVGKVWPNGASWTETYTGASNASVSLLLAPKFVARTHLGSTVYVGIFGPLNATTATDSSMQVLNVTCSRMTNDGFNVPLQLYYSASSFGSQKSATFLAKSSTGAPGSFSNQGQVYATSTSSNFNSIDPNLFVENGNWYLSLGSFWSGIKMLTVSPSTGKPTNSNLYSLANRPNNGGAVEASSIYKYGNYYYLFTSWDKCCQGTSSTYNIRVGRSTSVTGGYKDKNGVDLTAGGGTLVLGTHGSVVGPGGQDVFTDGDGPILVYHYYTSSGSKLGINRLDFSSGWPVVA